MRANIGQFKETEVTDAFALQGPKMLKVHLDKVTVQAKKGSMVAYQGWVEFEHAGGGVGRWFKKAATGEGTPLMKVKGTGELFLASEAQDIQLLYLEDEQVTCNGRNVLAFDAGIDWDINMMKGGVAGMMAGGLFNMTLRGTGFVAVVTHGPPVLLEVGGKSTFADAQAAVLWSDGMQVSVRTDVKLGALVGRGSGEEVQLAFTGTGWVLVQPSEGSRPAAARR